MCLRELLVGSPVDERLDEGNLQNVLAFGAFLSTDPERKFLLRVGVGSVAARNGWRLHAVSGLRDVRATASRSGVKHVAELVVVDP